MSSIQRRIKALEKQAGGSDPLIVYINSFKENPNGSPIRAIFADGPNKGLRIEREDGETGEAFENRVLQTGVSAISEKGLSLPKGTR